MVESQVKALPTGNPLDGRGIVAGRSLCRPHPRKERYGNGMASRVPRRIRENSDEGQLAEPDAGLFQQFTAAGVLDRLANLDKTSRQGVVALVRLVATTDQQHTIVRIEYDAVDGEQRCDRSRHAP